MNQILLLMSNLKVSTLAILGIVLAFLMPIIPLILIVGAAIGLDTVFGILRARKLKEPVTSRRLSKIVSKMVLYNSAVVLFFCIEKYVLGDFTLMVTAIPFVLTKLVTTTLLFIEITSISESYKAITGVSLWMKAKMMVSRGVEIKTIIQGITATTTTETTATTTATTTETDFKESDESNH